MKRSERKQFFAECGQKRRQNKMFIRAALLHNGHTEASLARQLGVLSQTVCKVIAGVLHSEDIIAALVQAGVPEAYLHDPRKEGHHAA
jgi:lambda repressor-like predicted transcriptional regulator